MKSSSPPASAKAAGIARGKSPRFSICVPNFNYERYLGETLASAFGQEFPAHEVLVSDNASTDGSLKVVESFRSERLKLRVNRCNVGFVGNLCKVGEMAEGDWMTLLSSDDLMAPDALSVYARVIAALGDEAPATVLASAASYIDGSGKITGRMAPDWKLWQGAVRWDQASAEVGADVWRIDTRTLLAHSLRLMRNPFPFLCTTYPRALYEAVEGYAQGGVINPDKRFGWALMGVADHAVFVDAPLFSYRVHNNNQGAQQAATGLLKHLTDEYVATFSTSDELLAKAGVTRPEMAAAFVEQDIALRGFKALAEGQLTMVRRMLSFGDACYPDAMRRNPKIMALRLGAASGRVGSALARRALEPAMRYWSKRQTGNTRP